MEEFHKPVLLKETIEWLNVKEGGKYIDATVGGGGHAIEIIKRGGKVLGIDCDPEAIKHVRQNLKCQISSFGKLRPFEALRSPQVFDSEVAQTRGALEEMMLSKVEASNVKSKLTLVLGNFRDLGQIGKREGFDKVDGILFDLGVSTHQLETSWRGFSFNSQGSLDMRMDPRLQVKAADLVNKLSGGELYEIFTKFGEENNSWAIAAAIVRARAIEPIKTCQKLAEIIEKVNDGRRKSGRMHPATKVFQALRMAVNGELENLKAALPQAAALLKDDGRLAVISFHSLEDRLVKLFFRECPSLKILTKKPIRPGLEEIRINRRARSAKLRIGEKI